MVPTATRPTSNMFGKQKPCFWVVADMDDTLLEKKPPGSKSPTKTFADSPCYEPVLSWLKAGGGLLVVTTDDGHRPFGKVWSSIPAELRRRVLISTSDGASLFRGTEAGALQEVMEYRAGPSAPRRGLPEGEQMEELLSVAREMMLCFFKDCLDGKHDARLGEGLTTAVDRIRDEMAGGKTLEEIVTIDRLALPGGFLPRASMFWRNQAGPVEDWCRAGGRDDVWWGCHGQGAFYTTLFVSGFPRTLSEPYLKRYASRFESLGCHASAAPNSVCVKSASVDKGAPVRWLANNNYEIGFDLTRSVAFGDNPAGNDRPLTEFEEMPFVSVESENSCESLEGVTYWVGGKEAGTASVLRDMLKEVGSAQHGTRLAGEVLAAVMHKLDIPVSGSVTRNVGDAP